MRYERGVDDNPVALNADMAAALIAEVSGGTVCPGMVDVLSLIHILEACGIGAFSLEDEGLSLAFHPRHISIVQALPVVLCRSINVLEETADGFIVRELKLEPVKGA